jgi:uncharacterized protein DUF3987
MSQDNVRSIFDAAVALKLKGGNWPEPDMAIIAEDEAPAPALEANALPRGWGKWTTEEAAACNVPSDYVAGGLIASASAWIGHARHVGATADWRESPHLWIADVGLPSTGKTPGMRAALEATRTIELAKENEPGWIEKCEKHTRETAEAKAYEEKWQSEVRDAVAAGKAPPKRPAKAEPPPALSAFSVAGDGLEHRGAAPPPGGTVAGSSSCVTSSPGGSALMTGTAATVPTARFTTRPGMAVRLLQIE